MICYLEREASRGPQEEEQEAQGCHPDHLQSTGRVRVKLFSPGQGPSPQTASLLAFPGQVEPAGRHLLSAVLRPPPQVTLQALQALHDVHSGRVWEE